MTTVIIFLIAIIFIFAWGVKQDRAETQRFREFVIAVKSKNIQQYVENVPEDNKPLEQQEPQELVDLEDMDPERALKELIKR